MRIFDEVVPGLGGGGQGGLVQDLKICIWSTKIKPNRGALRESKAQTEGFCPGAAEPPPDPARIQMNSGALSTFGF